ncbi:hypothetical protein DOTSEDRAFT_38851 [Dothistroma septosporum NZE10]|uniref:Uncharacterized protein n=1 Tax=Dothistroma septosporum (strain NZE10 / CBS 128990) TaxID=675120 RepID=M2YL78_DOTSN|nr:hypothetical protein DOTSEDRAFT_38851 [Dothistroma septosporum NZE10]
MLRSQPVFATLLIATDILLLLEQRVTYYVQLGSSCAANSWAQRTQSLASPILGDTGSFIVHPSEDLPSYLEIELYATAMDDVIGVGLSPSSDLQIRQSRAYEKRCHTTDNLWVLPHSGLDGGNPYRHRGSDSLLPTDWRAHVAVTSWAESHKTQLCLYCW